MATAQMAKHTTLQKQQTAIMMMAAARKRTK
jgi:hypothetical protein